MIRIRLLGKTVKRFRFFLYLSIVTVIFESCYKAEWASQKQEKRKFYSDVSNKVSIFIDVDDSFIFSRNFDSMITKEIGFCVDSADRITFYSGIPLDEFVEVEFIEGISDSLQISIKGPRLFDDLRLLKIVKDTAMVPFKGPDLHINKKQLIERLYGIQTTESWIQSDTYFISDLIIKSRLYYISLFNPSPTKQIIITEGSKYGRADYKNNVAFVMDNYNSFLLCHSCPSSLNIDTLFLVKNGHPN